MSDEPINANEAAIWKHVHSTSRNEPRWRGVLVVKYPNDLISYAQEIFSRTPTFIIETGTRYGGSALFFGDMLKLSGGVKVFSIDTVDQTLAVHPMVEFVHGSSIDPKVVNYIKGEIAKVPNASVMVSLDSDHETKHVYNELLTYKDIVTPGQYMVVEDCWTRRRWPSPPFYAVKKFLEEHQNFRKVYVEDRFIYAVTRGGWLLRQQ